MAFAFEAKYISTNLFQQFELEGNEIDKMLNGYIAYLKKSKQGANEPGANTSIREDQLPYVTDSLEDSINLEDTTL